METCRNRKVRVTIGTAEQNKRGDKNMLSQMNYRKETQPHGDELFPLSIHVFETDLQSTVRVYCHWHEEVELFYAVKGEAVFHMDTETFLLREGETAFVNANRLHEVGNRRTGIYVSCRCIPAAFSVRHIA